MFKRVLLCHDGTDYGRRALKQGAELAIALGSQVHVLIVVQQQALTAAVTAASLGHACVAEPETDYDLMVSQSIERLKVRGVSAQGHVAYGNVIEKIAECAKQQSIDLVVVGQYPRAAGRRWWSGPERQSLADSVDCAVLIAVNTEGA
jgi:nucleotide-binding universal stress UspA family protein